MNKRYMRFCEIVDSVKSLKEFIKMNDIKKSQIIDIIIVWDDMIREKK